MQIRKLFDQDQHFLLDPEKSGHLWQGEDFYLGFCSTAVIVSVVVNLRRMMKCRTWKRNCSSDCRQSSEADNHLPCLHRATQICKCFQSASLKS